MGHGLVSLNVKPRSGDLILWAEDGRDGAGMTAELTNGRGPSRGGIANSTLSGTHGVPEKSSPFLRLHLGPPGL